MFSSKYQEFGVFITKAIYYFDQLMNFRAYLLWSNCDWIFDRSNRLSHIKQNSDYPVDIKGKNMKKVSCLRLILLICGISLAVGENLKQNNGISMASNDSTTNKGLFFTISFKFL